MGQRLLGWERASIRRWRTSAYLALIHCWSNRWSQNLHLRESAWWGPPQLTQWALWGHSVTAASVGGIGGTALALPLQQPVTQRCSSAIWGPMQWGQVAPGDLQDWEGWPHFQQHWQIGTPLRGWASLMRQRQLPIIIDFPIRAFAWAPVWESQRSMLTVQLVLLGEFQTSIWTLSGEVGSRNLALSRWSSCSPARVSLCDIVNRQVWHDPGQFGQSQAEKMVLTWPQKNRTSSWALLHN